MDPTTAADYEIIAEIKNESTGFKLIYIGPVVPIDLTIEEILNTGNYLLMNKLNVEKLVTAQDTQDINMASDFNSKIELEFKEKPKTGLLNQDETDSNLKNGRHGSSQRQANKIDSDKDTPQRELFVGNVPSKNETFF